jgi:hypothetical protein
MTNATDLNDILAGVDEKQAIIADAKAHFFEVLQALQTIRFKLVPYTCRSLPE